MRYLQIILVHLSLLSHISTFGQYSVETIPAELKVGVDVVVRENVIKWRILSPHRSTTFVRRVVTVLNPGGDDHARVYLLYGNKLEKISNLKVNVYNALGLPTRKVKSSEIVDRAAYNDDLFNDTRVKEVDITATSYPYTVELQYETDYRYLYYNQGASLLWTSRMSCERFRYEITYPRALKPRYRALNFEGQPEVVVNSDGTESLNWEISNVKAIKPEPAGHSFSSIRPEIMAVPSVFEFGGYEGKLNSWEDFNAWQLSLNMGRDVISDATRAKVKELTSNLTTVEDRSKVLYEYLQGRTRYVSIQVGIGGWQPFEAKVVDEVGYGDCKALSNYMVALLKEAGIKGHYTLVRAGDDERPMVTDFPSAQFNHVIVGVPNGQDTIWLECTSQTRPFGYQGTFTGNRKALMITETGGGIVRTKQYRHEVNVMNRVASVDLLSTGDAKAQVTTTYGGLKYESGYLGYYITQSMQDQRKWILENTHIPNFNVDQFRMINNKKKEPTAEIQLELTLSRFASVSGKRIFMTPNLMNRSTVVPEQVASRKSNVVVSTGFIDNDSIVYSIPESIYPEFVPESIRYESRFGTYEATFMLDRGRLIYTRRLVAKEGEFPPESYQEYVEFYRNIYKADNLKMVFLSKT